MNETELKAILDAIQQVRETTGYGTVTVTIKDGRVKLIEVSETILLKTQSAEVKDEKTNFSALA